MSSIAPTASQEIAKLCAEKGVRMLEAPVSGGEPKAVDGTLSIMCGGEEALFDECKELLGAMGKEVVYCGPAGAGNTTKLAKRAGIDPHRVLDAIKGGLAGSTVMNAKGPMMLENDLRPGFRIDLHIKDLGNALDAGHKFGSPLPLTAQVMEMLQVLRADGLGQCDHSAIAKFYEKVTGETIY